jgi:hypothetical protein
MDFDVEDPEGAEPQFENETAGSADEAAPKAQASTELF